MKRANRNNMKAWAVRWPLTARVVSALTMLFLPLILLVAILADMVKRAGAVLAEVWDEKRLVPEVYAELFAVAFLPWSDK